MERLNPELLKAKEKRRPEKHKVQMVGISTFAVMLIAVIVLIVAGKTKTVRASEGEPITITAPDTATAAVAGPSFGTAIAVQPNSAGSGSDSTMMRTPPVIAERPELIPTTYSRNHPVGGASLSKNSDVFLTEQQEEFAEAFAKYLAEQGKTAIVTSGKRSSESQLDIIKERIQELGVSKKFPALQNATVSNTKSWLAAWNWLRGKKVPVNAPAAVSGAKSSLHIEGRAIDMIASDLDQLKNWLTSFSRSMYAKQTSLRIAGILREPGCIHVSLG